MVPMNKITCCRCGYEFDNPMNVDLDVCSKCVAGGMGIVLVMRYLSGKVASISFRDKVCYHFSKEFPNKWSCQ